MNRRGLLMSIVAGIAGLVLPRNVKQEPKVSVTIPKHTSCLRWRNYTYTVTYSLDGDKLPLGIAFWLKQ